MVVIMKLMLVSDLHLEFENKLLDVEDADVLVIAGDLCPWYHTDVLDAFFSTIKIPVVYVPGNHEYYRGSINDTYGHSNVFILDNTFVEIDGVKFAGSTFWSSPSHNTFSQINDKWISGIDIWELHRKAISFFSESWDADVIVTHFSPSMKSGAWQYDGSSLNDYFMNDREDLVGMHNEVLWVHGHTHNSASYGINGVDIICNPKGYFKENNKYIGGVIYEL